MAPHKNYFSDLLADKNSLLNVGATTPAAATSAMDYQAPYFGLDLTKLTPKFEDIYIGGARPQARPDLDALVELAQRRRRTMEEARANVDRRRQELREQGRLGYEAPKSWGAVNEYVSKRLPVQQYKQLAEAVWPNDVENITVRQMPGIGVATKYGDAATTVTGRYGTGIATPLPKDPKDRKEAIIEGKPASQWFAERAGEQGVSNRYATAVPTGVTDKQDPWGVKPRFTGKAVVAEAMSKKKAKA